MTSISFLTGTLIKIHDPDHCRLLDAVVVRTMSAKTWNGLAVMTCFAVNYESSIRRYSAIFRVWPGPTSGHLLPLCRAIILKRRVA